ncbi:MAG: DUF6673 family protein [Clostridium sp.]
MSQWKFGDFEVEVDFTDADFIDHMEEAKNQMTEDVKQVPKVGKISDIIRAQVGCFDRFFEKMFREKCGEKIRSGRLSLEVSLQAVDNLTSFWKKEEKRIDTEYSKYQVIDHGNRDQRRNYNKNDKKNYNNRG